VGIERLSASQHWDLLHVFNYYWNVTIYSHRVCKEDDIDVTFDGK
jgi:hypothetical protein